jgi:hypothetical protein
MADAAPGLELPPIELIPTMPQAGLLLDAAGQPLPDMRISAVAGNRAYGQAKSDEAGRFVLHLPEDLEVEEYKIFNDRGAQMVAEVIADTPLVLRVGSE